MAKRILYVVQRVDWRYNDEYHFPADEKPVKAFSDRQAAQALCDSLEDKA